MQNFNPHISKIMVSSKLCDSPRLVLKHMTRLVHEDFRQVLVLSAVQTQAYVPELIFVSSE